jgi:hypothetical protein
MKCNGNCDDCLNPIILNGEDPGSALEFFRIKCKAKNIFVDDTYGWEKKVKNTQKDIP